METNYKITIPKPCHEDWDQMNPDQTGRFCNSCAKSVVDFTKMKAPEIQEYFIKNQGQKVCGRFKNEQLDSIIIQIPREVLFSQIQFHKIFMLALLVSMPGLISCQNTNGDKQSINKVEVADSVNEGEDIGKVKIENWTQKDTVMTPERKARIENLKKKRAKLLQHRAEQKKSSGKLINKATVPIITGDIAIVPAKPEAMDKNAVYNASSVEIKPNFPGGLVKFYDYFKSNFKVAEKYKGITGKVILTFIVDADGSLTGIKILRGINAALDNEVVSFMKSSPKWIPGEQNGEKVKVSYSLPIKITAQ